MDYKVQQRHRKQDDERVELKHHIQTQILVKLIQTVGFK